MSTFKENNYNSTEINAPDIGTRLDKYLISHGVKWSNVHRSLRNKYYYISDGQQQIIKDPGYRLQQQDRVFFRKNS